VTDEQREITRERTRGALLGRNVAFNIAGSALPGIAALVAVPVLLRYLGADRFGLMALAWTALGYFSFFDLGIGRAVTHAIADRLGEGREDEVGSVIWTSLATTIPVGLVGGLLLFFLAPPLVDLLQLRAELRAEAIASFRVLAFAVPFATASGALRGALEAHQYFGLVNALRVPLGLVTFVGPMLVLPFSRSLVPSMLVLSVGRAVLALAHYVAVARSMPTFAPRTFDGGIAASLVRVGGWLQVSYLVSPLMVTLDRFIVGATLGASFVAYYVAPQELVTKLWTFNLAILPVFFSAVSTTSTRDPARTTMLFDRVLRVTLTVLFLPTLVLVGLAPDILRVWLGPAFEVQGTIVMQLIAIAVFVNCLGQGAQTLIQGLGRPDLTAKYHLVELPFYTLALWWLLPRFGLVGAAIAWSARAILDTIALLLTCPVLLGASSRVVWRIAGWMVATAVALTFAAVVSTTQLRIPFVVLSVPVWIYVCWRGLISAEERALPLRSLIAALRPERA
jgi:O-antigen/teichoic acid export membrane protein